MNEATPERPSVGPPSDEELARRAQQGCAASFEELVRRYQVPLLHFLRHHWPQRESDCEDLLQETFVRAYRNLDRYRPSEPFAPWVFTICRRLSMNLRRKRHPLSDSEAIDRVASAAPTSAQAVADAEHRGRLWDQVSEALTEQQHTTIWLFYVEQMSVKQIARVVGRSQVAVKTMMFRARQKLLGVLQGWNDEEGPEERPAVSGRACRSVEISHG